MVLWRHGYKNIGSYLGTQKKESKEAANEIETVVTRQQNLVALALWLQNICVLGILKSNIFPFRKGEECKDKKMCVGGSTSS